MCVCAPSSSAQKKGRAASCGHPSTRGGPWPIEHGITTSDVPCHQRRSSGTFCGDRQPLTAARQASASSPAKPVAIYVRPGAMCGWLLPARPAADLFARTRPSPRTEGTVGLHPSGDGRTAGDSGLRHPGHAQSRYDAFLSMTNEVRACKNLETVRVPLLVWLSSITAGTPKTHELQADQTKWVASASATTASTKLSHTPRLIQ